jgi:uncharacterized membrane protein SirB2
MIEHFDSVMHDWIGVTWLLTFIFIALGKACLDAKKNRTARVYVYSSIILLMVSAFYTLRLVAGLT